MRNWMNIAALNDIPRLSSRHAGSMNSRVGEIHKHCLGTEISSFFV